MHLAQLNLARLAAPLTDPRLADFLAGLSKINAIADTAPGFVWRLVDGEGGDATSLRPFGPDVIVNLTVWESIEALRAVRATRPRTWTTCGAGASGSCPSATSYAVNWWIPVDHWPTVEEASDRLNQSAGRRVDRRGVHAPHPVSDANGLGLRLATVGRLSACPPERLVASRC